MKENLPNFVVVGAAKSGTTSLYAYLTKHPEVYIPSVKEGRYFSQMPLDYRGPGDERLNQTIPRDLDAYKLLFSSVKDENAVGDVSPDYLYFYDTSIRNIKQVLGDVAIIIILRNPVDRAFSQYSHFLRDKRETVSFEVALKNEDKRKQLNWEWAWMYKDVGLYYKQVKAYFDNFSRVKTYLHDDLKNDALSVIQDIYEFIEVDNAFVPDNLNQRFNVSGTPKNKWLHEFINKPNLIRTVLKPFVNVVLPKAKRQEVKYMITKKNLDRAEMRPETREYLKAIYKEDILNLQKLIKRDLSQWLK